MGGDEYRRKTGEGEGEGDIYGTQTVCIGHLNYYRLLHTYRWISDFYTLQSG